MGGTGYAWDCGVLVERKNRFWGKRNVSVGELWGICREASWRCPGASYKRPGLWACGARVELLQAVGERGVMTGQERRRGSSATLRGSGTNQRGWSRREPSTVMLRDGRGGGGQGLASECGG